MEPKSLLQAKDLFKTFGALRAVDGLNQKNITVQSVETVEPTLEDVFTLPAHRGMASLVDR